MRTGVLHLLVALSFLPGFTALAGVPPVVRDLALEPATINVSPGPEYSDEQRDFAMVIGMDRTPKGRIWAAWVAGGDSDKGYFVAATSDDNGTSWSKLRLVIHPPSAPTGLRRRVLVGNFWTDPTGRLWLFYDQSMGYFDGRAGVWAITCANPDAEHPTWSIPRRIWHGATLNKPIVTKKGEWLLPISLWPRDRIGPEELRGEFRELDDQRMAHVFVSTDQGETWTRRGGVVVPQTEFDEHMFVELKDGRLWMLARTKYGIAETFSSDSGHTWTEPKASAIQNPSARFFLRRLTSGNLLLVKNGPLDRRIGRAQLTAFLSDNEGQSWKGGLVLDERNGVSYPDGFQSPDGTLCILHDHNRDKDREIVLERFYEADVLAGKLVTPGSQTKVMVSKALGPRIGEVLSNGIQLPAEWPPKMELSRTPQPPPPYVAAPPKVIPIDRGRQLFVDDFLIESTTLKRTNHRPDYFAGNPVLKADQPWEGSHAAMFSDGVWFDPQDGHFKLWYWSAGGTCLATSTDGIHWDKPKFDVVPDTNIVLADEPGTHRNSGTVWLDHEEKDPARRYKMFRVLQWQETDNGKVHGVWRIRASFSPDGIHWTTAGDSDTVADRTTVFQNRLRHLWIASLRRADTKTIGRYRHYYEGRDALSALHWISSDGKTHDVPWTGADELDQDRSDLNLQHLPERPWDNTPASQLYNLDCVAYESVLLGLFSIWRGQQVKPLPKINEVCVGYSRDGFHWSRPDRQAFCPVAANEEVWNSGNLQSSGGGCLVVGDKLYFYVGAVPKGSKFMDPGNVGLATMRRDGFFSLDADQSAGSLTTRPVAFNGTHLFVNVDCPQGELRVEVLDEASQVIAPFSSVNGEPVIADKTIQAIRWNGAADLSAVSGRAVRFRFHLTKGRLFSFWVSDDIRGASHGYMGAGGPGFEKGVDTMGVSPETGSAEPKDPLKR